jgi:TolB-like protein/DNA-binding SARP family transcriptional activator
MSEVRILLFGQPRLEVDGVPRAVKRRKVAALLAYLAMAERAHSRDELAELLYPHLSRERAYADLRQTLSYLKADLGDGVLEASSQNVAPLSGPGLSLDVAEFRARLSRAAGPREREDLSVAVKLYRAGFLQGFYLPDSPAFEEWQSGLAEELRSRYCSTLVRLHDLSLERGSLEQAVDCARSVVTADPLDELAQRRLMRALAAAGRKREAVRHYEVFRALLSREMAAEPEEETRKLALELRADPAGQVAAARAEEAGGGRKRGRPALRWTSGAAALALLLLAAGYFAQRQGYWPFAGRRPPPNGVGVGVLPFDNLSSDPEQAYFSDGLTQDLITALSSIPGLKTAPPSTMFAFRGRPRDARQLGRDLGLSHVLEGSVRKEGNRIRVNVQLTETGGGNAVWAKKFDRELSGIFEIQDDIVRSVVTELDVRLLNGEQARLWRASTKKGEAYDLYLRALHSPINPEGYLRALDLENQALALDTDFTAALWHKGLLLLLGPRFGFAKDPAKAFEEARRCFEKALRLDDRFADAHAAMGLLLFMEGKIPEAEERFELALSLGPHMESSHIASALFYSWKKDYPKALGLVRRAKELSLSPSSQVYAWEVHTLRYMGRLDEALAVSRQALELFPDSLDIIVNYANVLRLLKRRDDLALAIKRIKEIQPDFSSERWAAVSGTLSKQEQARLVAEMHAAGFP